MFAIRRFPLFLFFSIFIQTAAHANNETSLTAGLYFRLPPCLPHCTLDDRGPLNEDSYIENQVITAIDKAKSSIRFQQFTFSRRSVFEALVRAADRGVTVQGIMDGRQFNSIGRQCNATRCNLSGPYVAPDILALKPSERLKVIEERRLWPAGASITEKLAILLYQLPESGVRPQLGKDRLMHNKFVLVDNEILISGSGNWSSTGMGINMENIDTVLKAEEPVVVQSFACMFDAVWSGDPAVITPGLRRCEVPPRVNFTPAPDTGIKSLIVEATNSALASIDISMHHLTHPDVINALSAAAGRGVAVRVMVDDDDCIRKLPASVRQLMAAGVTYHYMPTNCEMFQLSHNKFGIFDNKKVINGSGNWSRNGLHRSYENFIVYEKPEDVKTFINFFAAAWSMAQPREQCTCNPREPECRKRYCLGRQLR